jgi:flagellar basal body-associated protein FliL
MKKKKTMSELDTATESNSIVFIVVIGIVCVCVIGFVFYRLRKRTSAKQPKSENNKSVKEVPKEEIQHEDPLKNCRTFPTTHGLRIFKCNEQGDPIQKIDI